MALFKRKKSEEPEGELVDDDAGAEEDAERESDEPARPALSARPHGPWDSTDEHDEDVQRLDLGGLLVPVPADTEVRVDMSSEGQVVAATLVHRGSSVQVNAFAAPRSEGIWPEILAEIASSLSEDGGQAETLAGAYGPELLAMVPTQVPDQGVVLAPARFVGVDGPRWFLRALFTGAAASDPQAAEPLEAALRAVVVVRGNDPMAVRDPLPLQLPPEAQQAQQAAAEAAAAEQNQGVQAEQELGEQEQADPLALQERGPEITETR